MADLTFCLFVFGCSRFTRRATGTSRVSSACVLRSCGLALITASCLPSPKIGKIKSFLVMITFNVLGIAFGAKPN